MDDAFATLAHSGEATASLAGYRCLTERSPSSESTYLHVRRRGVWYGLRLSCHAPAYACSRDYEQLIVPRQVTERLVAELAQRVSARVRHGGAVVADPREVRRAIRSLLAFFDDGRRYTDRARNTWVWSAADRLWRADGATSGPPPRHRPRPSVTDRLRSSVRHEKNLQARWELELAGGK